MLKANKVRINLKKPRLKTKLETLNYLKDINYGLACLANNHFYDNLEEGFQETINFLTNNNINYIGASMIGREEIPFIFNKDDGMRFKNGDYEVDFLKKMVIP